MFILTATSRAKNTETAVDVLTSLRHLPVTLEGLHVSFSCFVEDGWLYQSLTSFQENSCLHCCTKGSEEMPRRGKRAYASCYETTKIVEEA